MDEKKVNNLIDSYINDYSAANQFGVSKIPAHTHNRTDSLPVDFSNLANRIVYINQRLVDKATNTATGTNIWGDYVMSFNGYIDSVGATVDTAGTTGDTTINIKKNGTSIFKTKITINTTKKTSRTATTQPLLDKTLTSFKIGDILTFDVDTISTTPAKGLSVFINILQP